MKVEKKACIEIHFIVDNYSNSLGESILMKLKKIVSNEEVEVELSEALAYWKIPGKTECFFKIYSDVFFTVERFISLINVSWSYNIGRAHHADDPLKRPFRDEGAIWSNNVSGGEILIDKNIIWAHVYTGGKVRYIK